MSEIYNHREVVWLRTQATDSQIGEILKQRDEAIASLAILRNAWTQSWDCSRDPGHEIMNKAFEELKQPASS